MPTIDPLKAWIGTLRDRLGRDGLAHVAPFDLGDGTGGMPGERTIRIMLADLDHLDALPPEARDLSENRERRRALLEDFRRLRAVIS